MASQSPRVDNRTASDINGQVRQLMQLYVPQFNGAPTGPSAALIGIFARYAETTIQRLNQAPDKNFLAFLDLLGASLLPPRPARVPLTFSLAAGSASDGLVPIGTQVAAPPGPGETEPVIFETERELVVTAAELASVYARDPNLDQYASIGALMALGQQPTPFAATTPIDHIFYVGHDALFGYPNIDTLTLHVVPDNVIALPVSWERWDTTGWVEIVPASDSTLNLTREGNVVFKDVPQIAASQVRGVTSRWLRCRLKTPMTPAVFGRVNLPTIRALTLQVGLNEVGLSPDAAFTNALPIDVTKDFFPLGEKPRFGDTFYIAQGEGFSEPNAAVTLHVTLTNPAGGPAGSTPPPTYNAGSPKLSWEFWDGTSWVPVGTSELPAARNADGTVTIGPPKSTPTSGASFDDGTAAFTRTGDVKLAFPKPPQRTTVNGIANAWLRVRLVGGNYGTDAIYRLKTPGKPEDGYVLDVATLSPPIVQSCKIDYAVTKPPAVPSHILTYNDFDYVDATGGGPFQPFRPTDDSVPSLYLGFALPPGRLAFPNRPLSLYARVADISYGTQPDTPTPSAPPHLTWQYFNGQTWLPLTVQDDTQGLVLPGLIEMLVPADSAASAEFGETRTWLRVRWERGQYLFTPHLQRLTLNTTLAAQTTTIPDEILGTSDGSRGQTFRTTRAPILAGQRLLIRETEMPSVTEQATIKAEEGEDAIFVTYDSAGRPTDIWVRWHEMPDFYASGPRDRHYVLDHITGMVQFGDGLNGLIPPLGAAVRMGRYQTGGGVAGNRPTGTIVQLKTTVPYVDRVINYEPAAGGAAAEPLTSLIDRAPRTIRHRDRAVTIEDYADLAMLASPAVARTRAVPLYDLLADPLATPPNGAQAGVVSVMIVPHSDDTKPVPTLELMQEVQRYIEARNLPTARVVIVGPLYVRINVTAEIAVASLDGASRVQTDVTSALTRFLHPLSGGLDGAGWDFGRAPHKSDLYALIEAIPSVDHVRKLIVTTQPEPANADTTDRFLVYSGTHTITLTAERF